MFHIFCELFQFRLNSTVSNLAACVHGNFSASTTRDIDHSFRESSNVQETPVH